MEHHEGVRAVVGNVAPDFTLPTLDGTPVSLHALKGRWIILFTWGSW